jgi:4-alpha-glucanotransferase
MSSVQSTRRAGLLAPLFCLRRDGDLGVGDVGALRELIDWAGNAGIGFIQLLPVTESGPDHSPYNAISSVALDPIYLDLAPDHAADVTASDIDGLFDGEDLLALRGPSIDYTAVVRVKTRRLRHSFERFWSHARGGAGRADFERFRRDEAGWLDEFVIFRWLMELAGGSPAWDRWPAEFGTGPTARRFVEAERRRNPAAVDRELAFFAWVQWLAASQWRRVRAYADQRGVQLMGDVPIGVSYHSADVFFRPHLFHLDWSGGSPPESAYREDLFTCRWGQNWGVPLYNWEAMKAEGFAWWRQRVRKSTEIFEMFRIDHVLGFYRFYAFPWRPERNGEFLPLSIDQAAVRAGNRMPRFHPNDDSSAEGAASNCEHGDQLLEMVQEAAETAIVLGEDLGVVPDYVRPHLLSRGIAGFKIPQWEEPANGGAPHGSDFPACSLATFATHDLPPIRTLWEEWRAGRRSKEPELRARTKVEWSRLVGFANLPREIAEGGWSDALKWKLFEALFGCASRFVCVSVNDFFGLPMRFNTPGTAGDHNWTTRLPWTVRQFSDDFLLAREARRFLDLAKKSHRV